MHALVRLTLVFALLALPLIAQAQGRPAGVGTALVEMRQTSETVPVFGEVVSGRESAVAARVGGVAAAVPVRVGDIVRAGDVLARLDTELLQIELVQAEAEITIAEAGVEVAAARMDRAEKALRRAETLRANSTIAEAQLEDRLSEYAEALGNRQVAMARINAAESALAEAQYRVDNAVVRAPFDGVVLQVATEIGQFIPSGSQVATLIDIGAMEVEANVPARFVDALTPGQVVLAQTDAGGALTLSLRALLPTEFAATRTRPVRFEVVSSEQAVAVGQSVTLDVPVSAPREVLVVPKDALTQARGGWSVFVNDAGKAQPRTVEIGAPLEGGFEVLSGLAVGDEVVIRGNERLRPGQDIAPMNAPPAAAAPAPEEGTPRAVDAAEGETAETQG